MNMDDYRYMLQFGDADFKMILDGLDSLKSKDFGGEVMGMMIETLLKPKGNDPVAIAKWKEHEDEEKLKKIEKEVTKMKLSEEIDFLKAKIAMTRELKRRNETKNPERQLEVPN